MVLTNNGSGPSLGVNGTYPQRKVSGLGLLRIGNSPIPDTPRHPSSVNPWENLVGQRLR